MKLYILFRQCGDGNRFNAEGTDVYTSLKRARQDKKTYTEAEESAFKYKIIAFTSEKDLKDFLFY